MGKKLAIKGHSTRGKEVIKLLKMMGGRDVGVLKGNHDYYVIDECENNLIKFYGHNYIYCHEFVVLTLEEFLEKYPFKIGDLVDRNIDYVSCIIDDMRWNSEKCCVEYHLNYLNGSEYGWHVSDCLIKPENVDVIIGTKIESTGFMQIGKTVSVIFNSENYEDEVELQLGDYEIAVRDGKTYAIRKKPTYPNNFDDCFNTVADELNDNKEVEYFEYKYDLLDKFKQLLICRDAYWKIAGEEMGLDGSWKPDWLSGRKEEKYCIATQNNEIWHNFSEYGGNEILAFPTIEIRDAFYENFKELIEECKELL